MAATADPRAKPPTTQPHHLKPWAPPHGRRVPSLPAASGGAGAARDRRRSSSTSHRRGGTRANADAAEEEERHDGGLEDLRAKLMGHLRDADAADRLRLAPPQQPRSPDPEPPAAPLPPPPEDVAPAVAAGRTWNLRERKRRRPSARGSGAASVVTPWSAKPREADGERAPFTLALEAEEIEEDIYALTGARPRRRPRKRPRVVQRQLDSLLPGLWLTEITADAYRVPDG